MLKILILYMCHEMIKGQGSFYHPYFAICTDLFLENWSHWEMTALEDKDLTNHLKSHKEEMNTYFL
jgi:hypothetical protein